MTPQVMMVITNIPSFIKKGKMVSKILTGQIIFPEDLNPRCDLDLENSNPKLPHNTLARDDAPMYQVWLQKVQNFRRLFF